jgi:predicted nuclease of predicted toxin-antitoxin system
MRRVLFDEDVPRQLRRDLPTFIIRTVQEQGWSALKNGELLRTASNEFAVLLTADKNLQYQQNIATFEIGVVVLASSDTRLPSLRTLLAEIRSAIEDVSPGTVVRVPGTTK